MRIFNSDVPFYIVVLIVLTIGLPVYRYSFWTFVDSYEVGYKYDKRSGVTTVLPSTGWESVVPFFTEVHTVDTRPVQIRIEAKLSTSSVDGINTRVLNAMLVRFRPEGLLQLLQYHGRMNYDQTTLAEILKIYAYEGCATDGYSKEDLQNKYKFLKIMSTTSDQRTDIHQSVTVPNDTVK